MQDPLLGYQLGNYRLVQALGQGSFAQVYRGQHIHLGVSVAVKVLHAQLGEQEKQSFQKEAVMLTTLKHVHIIRFLDYGLLGGRPYLVTDLAEKGSLHKIYPHGTRLPLPQIVDYIAQIADGLDFAHSLNIVHRDIKPENILVSDTGQLLLADFGIAKLMSTTGSYGTGTMSGTLPYMAPELFDGHPSPPSDQYALGVMVYEWLTGRFPFDGTPGEIIKRHLQDTPPPVRRFNSSVSEEIEQVVLASLEKDPKKRFRTVQAFANALRQAGGFGSASQALPIVKPQPGNPSPIASDPARRADPIQPQQQPGVGSGSGHIGIGGNQGIWANQPGAIASSPALPRNDALEWQKLMPPPRALAFKELPSLPQAELTDFWWPTFIVATDQRRKINQGTIPFEVMSALGALTSFPSVSVALPISSTPAPLSIGNLHTARRLSGIRPLPLPSDPPFTSRPPIAGYAGHGRTLQPIQPGQPVPPIQPVQPGQIYQPRIAQPVVKPGTGVKQPGPAVQTSSRGTGAAVIAIIALIIGILCTTGNSHGSVAFSWFLLGISFISNIIGLAQTGQRKTLQGWLIFFLVVTFIMLFVNAGVYSNAPY